MIQQIYVAKNEEGHWLRYEFDQEKWRIAYVSDMLEATHNLNPATNQYEAANFRIDSLNKRPDCPIEWNPIKGEWSFSEGYDPLSSDRLSIWGVSEEDRLHILQKLSDENRAEILVRLREELTPIVKDEIVKEIGDSVRKGLEIELTKTLKTSLYDEVIEDLNQKLAPEVAARLRIELKDTVRKDLERETREKLRLELTPCIAAEIQGKLISEICLSEREISDAKKKLIESLNLTNVEISEQKSMLREKIEQGVRSEIEKIREKILNEIGETKIQQFRKNIVDENRDAVIADLYRSCRPHVEGTLRKELTLKILREIISTPSRADFSETARQVEYSLREGLSLEVRQQEFQNALFEIRENIQELSMDEKAKDELTEIIDRKTRNQNRTGDEDDSEMKARPLSRLTTTQLEERFKKSKNNLNELEQIHAELEERTRSKALNLKKKVKEEIVRIKALQADVSQKGNIGNGGYGERPKLKKTTDAATMQSVISTNPVHSNDWDPAQKLVIESDEKENVLVEAGPGTGKTAVACARVARLIEENDLLASKILLISFTRTAVREIRSRIEKHVSHPAKVAGLKIATLDSFTWQIVQGLGDRPLEVMFQSYDGNIGRFVEMLRDKDDALIDHVQELEHVVIDEGQDLVGPRADLCIELIKVLPDHCGATIFADSAQAIYGFTNDTSIHAGNAAKTVVERINVGEVNGFQRFVLDSVHRTNDQNLINLYTQGRRRLVDRPKGSNESWEETRDMILRHAHGQVGEVEHQELKDRNDCLVLFRTRAEVLMASSLLWTAEVSHKVRMSGVSERIHPWIGRLLADQLDKNLSQSEFEKLWEERIGSNGQMNGSWKTLLSHVAENSAKISLSRLRQILSRERPPIEFLVDEMSLQGPVLGTIHASKGREASRVHRRKLAFPK